VADAGNHAVRAVALVGPRLMTTVAGVGGVAGYDDADDGPLALFNAPRGLALRASDGALFVADALNGRVRLVAGGARAAVTTFAGGGGGAPALAGCAAVCSPACTIDAAGAAASFCTPRALAYDGARGVLYVSDDAAGAVRAVSAAGAVTTLAGGRGGAGGGAAWWDALGTAAAFAAPKGLALSADGGLLYVADAGAAAVRAVSTASGQVSTLAGGNAPATVDGPTPSASFACPAGVALGAGGALLVVDECAHVLRSVACAGATSTPSATPSPPPPRAGGYCDLGMATTTVAGVAGVPWISATTLAGAATFLSPQGVAVDAAGAIFVGDDGARINTIVYGAIRVIANGVVGVLAGEPSNYVVNSGDGIGATVPVNRPQGDAGHCLAGG